MFDMVLRGGRLIDPSTAMDGIHDVAIHEAKIAAIEKTIREKGKTEISLSGLTLCPGLIDFHTHVYSGTLWGIDADTVGPRSGVTTFVDFGTAGPGNFEAFLRHVVQRSRARIYEFLHIAYNGVVGTLYDPASVTMIGELEDIRFLCLQKAIETAERHRDVIRGIKVRASVDAAGSNTMAALTTAKEAAVAAGLPLAVHIGQPPLPAKDALRVLESGDILTHAFRGTLNSLLDRNNEPIKEAYEARKRGVLFDIGYGKGSCSFAVSKELISHHFLPDIVSSDLHTFNIDGPTYDLPTTMMKFVAMGMELKDVLKAATLTPARALGLADRIGSIIVGHEADVCVFKLGEEGFDSTDPNGVELHVEHRMVPMMTIRGGEILWRHEDVPA